ncbi:hypothetical protein G195_011647, partial [Phytophthora kernoviae 00238/432]
MRTSLLLLALLALTLPLSSAAASSSLSSSSSSVVSASCDEDYEQLDTSTGLCECRDGFSGLGCRMCTVSDDSSLNEDVCSSTFGDGYSCATGLSYDAHTSIKTYGCTLSTDLQALFPDGALDISCDRNEDGVANCLAAVFKAKDTVQGDHMIDCNMTQCTFATGKANGECADIDCKCGSACSTTTKLLVEGTLSGKPAKIEVTNTTELSIVIEGSPIPLSATCTASAWSVSRGQVLGLLGPSGSGKTTLLNALAAVENGQSQFSGELLLDGKKRSKGYRRIAAYVQQDDSLYSTLTVRECISYSAQLRLPASLSDSAKSTMVDRVIAELNLTHVANSRIGSVANGSGKRGVSGGERRRVSIGMELVTSPQILILDEPTSGLDSSSAHSVVQLVKDLAGHGRIVVLSIHQPSARSFLLLDQIMLLGKGKLLYSGAPADSKRYFQDLGFKCPEHENIADFILDIASDTANIPM